MKIRTSLITVILILMTMGYTSLAIGAVGADEANKLGGPMLTPIGAERAGNKDGSIPAWTGVPIPIPKGFNKDSGVYVDPFADEKPLFSINQKNMAQYADKLAEGVKALMKRYPDYRIDVYKTHRTMVYPQGVYDNTGKCATACQLIKDGEALMGQGCHGGTPFPLAKTGLEAIWNHATAYNGPGLTSILSEAYNITPTGKVSLSSQGTFNVYAPWYDPQKVGDSAATRTKSFFLGPPRRYGEQLMAMYQLDWVSQGSVVWQYLPGQRRVRLAPDVCCDTPNPSTGGASTYDDMFIFAGNPDRYNWKLVGKKEMYIPYNAYKVVFHRGDINKVALPRYVNPDMVRWELHRVWVLEATLKPDKRHIYGKRVMYLDEDSWFAVIGDNYDKRGNFYRFTVVHPTYSYDVQNGFYYFEAYYDLISNSYAISTWPHGTSGLQYLPAPPNSYWSPDSMAGGGLR